MKIYSCRLRYSDGLKKNLRLNQKDFDKTFDAWQFEIESGELLYLKIIFKDEKK